MHSYIHQRDERIYKRFNLIIAYKDGKVECCRSRNLLSKLELEAEYLSPFYKSKPVYIDGFIVKPSTTNQLAGKRMSEYTIISLLDNGKSAAVFKAQKDNIDYAVKIFDNELVERIGHEIQIKRIEQEISLKAHTLPDSSLFSAQRTSYYS